MCWPQLPGGLQPEIPDRSRAVPKEPPRSGYTAFETATTNARRHHGKEGGRQGAGYDEDGAAEQRSDSVRLHERTLYGAAKMPQSELGTCRQKSGLQRDVEAGTGCRRVHEPESG